jgi:hypothetical protein
MINDPSHFIKIYTDDLRLFSQIIRLNKLALANPYLYFKRYDQADYPTYKRFRFLASSTAFVAFVYSFAIYSLNLFAICRSLFLSIFPSFYRFSFSQKRSYGPSSIVPSESNLVFLSHINNESDVVSSEDFYYPGVCKKLSETSIRSEFLLSNKPEYPDSIQNTLKNSRGLPCHLIPNRLSLCSEMRIHFEAVWASLSQLIQIFNTSNVHIAFKSRCMLILIAAHSRAAIPNLRAYNFLSKYLSSHSITDVVFPFEGNCWEAMILLIASQKPPITTHAFLHSFVDTKFPAFNPLAFSGSCPSKFIISHSSYAAFLNKIFSNISLFIAPPVGFTAISRPYSDSSTRSQDEANHLTKEPYFIISPDGFLPETLLFAKIAYEAASNLSLSCIFTIHPYIFSQCKGLLPKHPLLTCVKGPLSSEIMAGAFACVFQNSTACLLSASYGVSIARFTQLGDNKYDDIIPLQTLSSACELYSFLLEKSSAVNISPTHLLQPFDPVSFVDIVINHKYASPE